MQVCEIYASLSNSIPIFQENVEVMDRKYISYELLQKY